MRQRLVACAAAATLAATAAAPAFADSDSNGLTASSAFTCKATASLTQNGKNVYTTTRSFISGSDVSGSYTRSYTFNGVTYTVSASVSCTN